MYKHKHQLCTYNNNNNRAGCFPAGHRQEIEANSSILLTASAPVGRFFKTCIVLWPQLNQQPLWQAIIRPEAVPETHRRRPQEPLSSDRSCTKNEGAHTWFILESLTWCFMEIQLSGCDSELKVKMVAAAQCAWLHPAASLTSSAVVSIKASIQLIVSSRFQTFNFFFRGGKKHKKLNWQSVNIQKTVSLVIPVTTSRV